MLYLTQHELSVIKAIDVVEVEKLIDRALDWRQATNFHELNLSNCGMRVANLQRIFERDLANYAKSKASAKVAETRSRAWSSGHDLIWAVREMKKLAEEQEKETELFRVDDLVVAPRNFSEQIRICIVYQWRRTVQGSWAFGSITFVQDVDMRPDYSLPQPKKKLSAAKQEEKRQQDLCRHWQHLRDLALHAVHGFLKSGGDGSTIPETFKAKPQGYDRYLNNFSCDFWRAETTDDAQQEA